MTLVCIECGETSEDGEGWKAELAVKLIDRYEFDVQAHKVFFWSFDVQAPREVAVFCPRCWSREFSDS